MLIILPGQRPLYAPVHTPAAPPRPHSTHSLHRIAKRRYHPGPFAPPYPKQGVTLPLHLFTAVSHPTPHRLHLFTAPAPFLPTTPPQFRNLANALETHVHPCYPRPREEPTPRPGSRTPRRGEAPGIRRGALVDARWQRRRLSYSVTRCHACVPETRAGHYRFGQYRRLSQLRNAQNVTESSKSREGAPAMGAPGVLSRARAAHTH